MSIQMLGKIKNRECNKTHLDIEHALNRGIIHRDYIAHCLRWTHVLKHAKINMNILDIGCADGLLAQVLYTNRFRPNYIGIDIREKMLEKANVRKYHKELNFICMDITKTKLPFINNWADVIVCFEVIEHIPADKLDFILKEMLRCIKKDGVILLSTPNYDGIHKAKNHIHEYRESELEDILTQYFVIVHKFGTFASQKEFVSGLTGDERGIFERLRIYYDSNMLSVILAPLYASLSRNILWEMKCK